MFNKNELHLEEITMKTEDRFNTENSPTFSALTRAAVCAPKAKAEQPLSGVRLRRLILGAAMAVVAAAPARSAILFKPVGRPPEVFTYNGETMSKPLSNTGALNSAKLYFIFVGPNFGKDGDPSPSTLSLISAAKTIVGSSYLSGLEQYGSDGHATYTDGDYTIDDSIDPTKPLPSNLMWDEVGKYTKKFKSWLPAADGLNPPIYIVVHYRNDGTANSGSYQGYNNGPNSDPSLPYNAISVNISSVGHVDGFSWVLSHELVERISSGTGRLKSGSGQIADGEPENGDGYDWRLNGPDGPMVTSYWSFVDQAFIIPDGNLDRTLLVPVWDSDKFTHTFLSLQQGTLYQIATPGQKTPIDTGVQSFTVNLSGGAAQIFDLTADGDVKLYSGGGWFVLNDSGTVASALVGTSHLVKTDATNNKGYSLQDGTLYMLATKDGSQKVWEYSGTNWKAVTGSEYTGISIAAANGELYMTANNFGVDGKVWKYSGKGTDWDVVTASNIAVYSIVSVDDTLYMTATDKWPTKTPQVWRYNSSDSTWATVTDADTIVYGMMAAGDTLCTLSSTGSDILRVWQYGLDASDWFALSDKYTQGYTDQILVQDGSELFIAAANDKGIVQIWQYKDLGDWTVVTPSKMNPQSASVGPDNRLYAVAYNDSGRHTWIYNGTPGSWSIAK